MGSIITVIWNAMPGIASAAVLALCGAAYRKLHGFKTEHTGLVKHLEEYEANRAEAAELRSMQEAQNVALRELLGKELDREHARLVAQGYASPAEKAAFERLYKAYHGLGGNGTRTALYEDVLQMRAYKIG